MHRFTVLLKPWLVARTFAWLDRFRRLAKDREFLLQASETFITILMLPPSPLPARAKLENSGNRVAISRVRKAKAALPCSIF